MSKRKGIWVVVSSPPWTFSNTSRVPLTVPAARPAGVASMTMVVGFFAGTGLSATLLPGALWAQAEGNPAKGVTLDMVIAAEKLAGVEFTDAQRQMLLEGVNVNLGRYAAFREIPLDNSLPSSLQFSPVLPGMSFDMRKRPMKASRPSLLKPRRLISA